MRIFAILASFASFAAAASTQQVDFNREIRPILSDNCFACHGPDAKQRVADLRLDDRESIFAERKGYRIIAPGDPKSSRLIERITSTNKAIHMPPVASGYALNDKQIGLLRDWVAQGARWESHWAFVAPKRPAAPAVKRQSWIRNPIDAFVLARLEKEGLQPSAEADRVTLLRRLSFDLSGLPPTLAEIDAYVSDKTPQAYEKQVDRLLASPRYAERMATQWLDLARYADTHGYHIDSHRDMWPWRDWLIRAFSANMPFDRFVTDQLAGDLVEKPTRDQLVATGFNRNHMINYEGGAIEEEYQVEYVMDRVDATSTVFLGMTMGCARCHDHKYDPISQKDFYRFFAFFNKVPERGLDGKRGNADPKIMLPDAQQEPKLEATRANLKQLREQLNPKKIAPSLNQWASTALIEEPSREGLAAHFEFDGNVNDSSGRYQHGRVETGKVSFANGPVAQELRLDGQTRVTLGDAGDFEIDSPFAISLWIRPNTSHSPNLKDKMLLLRRMDPKKNWGWELSLSDVKLSPRLRLEAKVEFHFEDKTSRISWHGSTVDRRVLIDDLNHIALSSDGRSFSLWVNGELIPIAALALHTRGVAMKGAPHEKVNAQIEAGVLGSPSLFRGGIDDLRIYSRALTQPEVERLITAEPARAALRGQAESRSTEQSRFLREYFLTNGPFEELRTAFAKLKQEERNLADLEFEVPNTMVMADKPGARETHILGRGDYQNKGEVVSAATPAVLPPMPPGARADRLGVAQWLLDPSNPLTARVAVNRYWQMYFGTGLVKTSEDFGAQGESPSHPELLDWLATEFRESGWNIRQMQKLIVMSATYRQSSKLTPALIERDPENRLLARGARVRLPAEMIRDNALAASGLLVEKLGGPSVKSYQPNGLWEDIAFGGPYSAQSYEQDHGEALYRRSMYMLWKRTSPPPSLATFDAPNREKCVARRSVTNTPLQALVLMNDPQYLEAARTLAQRSVKEGGATAESRIAYGFRLATGRKPIGREIDALKALLNQELASYQSDAAKTASLLSIGESKPDAAIAPPVLAAWTMVASTMLSLDETITKE